MLGIRWLLGLQNQDGGMPTLSKVGSFTLRSKQCRHHRARHPCMASVEAICHSTSPSSIQVATRRALDYLKRMQKEDGSWDPLWFGNQHLESENNPLYGTARSRGGLACLTSEPTKESGLSHAIHWR